jgi:hypothetical protein
VRAQNIEQRKLLTLSAEEPTHRVFVNVRRIVDERGPSVRTAINDWDCDQIEAARVVAQPSE